MGTHACKPAALITGASSGIGYELAKLFAGRNGTRWCWWPAMGRAWRRSRGEFSTRYGVQVFVTAFDLADPKAPERIYAAMQEEGLPIGALVNNAGFGTHGLFAETDLKTELEELQVNVVALTHLTKLFLRPMLAAGAGRIMNVSSTAAYLPGPLMAVYYASKAYVLSFSEALSNEVEGTGVTVTCLVPGPTETEFKARAGLGEAGLFKGHVMRAEEVGAGGI